MTGTKYLQVQQQRLSIFVRYNDPIYIPLGLSNMPNFFYLEDIKQASRFSCCPLIFNVPQSPTGQKPSGHDSAERPRGSVPVRGP